MKESLIGEVLDNPRETKDCLRFTASFNPHEETEVVISKRDIRALPCRVRMGDRVVIRKWGNIGDLRVAARDLTVVVNVP